MRASLTSPPRCLLSSIIIVAVFTAGHAQTPCGRPYCPKKNSAHRSGRRHDGSRIGAKQQAAIPESTLTIETEPGSEIVINYRRHGFASEAGILVTTVKPDEQLTVVSTKPGFEPGTISTQLKPGERTSVSVKLVAKPATMSVNPSVSETDIYVSGLGMFKDRVSGLKISPGTYSINVSKFCYRSESREVVIKGAENWVFAIPLTLLPVDDLLILAKQNWQKENFDNALTAVRHVLTSAPGHPYANLLMGSALYAADDFPESTRYLLIALQGGEQIALPISFHSGSDYQGYLLLSTQRLEFHSTDKSGPAVSVPTNKIYRSEAKPRSDYRLRVVVGIPGNKREDRRTLDFNVIRGMTRKSNCATCEAELELLLSLVMKIATGQVKNEYLPER